MHCMHSSQWVYYIWIKLREMYMQYNYDVIIISIILIQQ